MSDTAATSAEPTGQEPVAPEPVTPAAEPTPEPEVQPQDLSFLTEPEEELDADLLQEPVSEPTPAAEPKVEEPKTPVGEPAPLIEAEPPAAAEPVQPPAEPVAEPTAPTAPAPQLTQEQLAEHYGQWRGQAEELLATRHYAIDEQMAENLTENAGEVIPRLMSKVYMDAVTAAIGHVMNVLPQAVETTLQVRDLTKANEDAFYGAWPQLERKAHHDTIVRLGMAYRQVDPNASLETFIKNVGAQAMIALKVPMEQPVVEPAVVPTPPFRPAGGSPPSGGPVAEVNPFSTLANEFEEEDADLG